MRKEDQDLPKTVPPGAANPLGEYAIYLGWRAILIHGTNIMWTLGTRSTHGCIRLYPEDIKLLYELVAIGTKVRIINEPIKKAFLGADLYIEVHPDQEQKNQLDSFGCVSNLNLDRIKEEINKFVSKKHQDNIEIDWDKVALSLKECKGIPMKINY